MQFLKELHSSIPELPPIIVIATKIDLRETSDESKRRQLLTSAEIRHFAKTINAVNYFECSAVRNVSNRSFEKGSRLDLSSKFSNFPVYTVVYRMVNMGNFNAWPDLRCH